ncbi:MAG: hypothetical protein AAF734_11970, partial [Bacteroidota bacterium]
MKTVYCLLTFITIHIQVFSQLNNQAFEWPISVDSNQIGRIRFQLGYLGYLKNNEYFDGIADGYTLFGQQLQPKVTYQPSPHLLIEAGLFMRQDFGESTFAETEPIFTLKYQKKHFRLVFGTLEGNLQHRLIEPLYDFERVIDDRIEQGIQFLYKSERFRADVWTNWRRTIQRNRNEQEEIEGAWYLHYLMNPKSRFQSKLILQSSLLHRGEQSSQSNLPIYTTQNHALGFQTRLVNTNVRFLKGLSMEHYVLLFTVDSDSLTFSQGTGLYLNGTIHTKWGDWMTSYWRGNDFINLLGGDLYSSEARMGGTIEPQRNLLIFRWLKDFELIPRCYLTARAEPYYDLDND